MNESRAGGGDSLLHNLVLFGRLLRAAGMEVTPARLADLTRALTRIDLGRREDFRNSARALLVSRHDQLAIFDLLFELFWSEMGRRKHPEIDLGKLLARSTETVRRTAATASTSDQGEAPPERDQASDREQRIRLYSAREALRRKDFARLTPDELLEVRRMMEEMVWEPPRLRSRRRYSYFRGDRPDLRGWIRESLRHGTEPLVLKRRRRRLRRRPLLILSDISGSMEAYSRLLLRFVFVLSRGKRPLEAFLFGTRLTRVTRELHAKKPDRAMQRIAEATPDFGGGTRIGESLKQFNFRWARRVLTGRSVVLIISDGWDCGSIELLSQELERLRRSCRRLIWLNPLLGSPGYQPLTQGIRAVVPRVDDFLPVHNLASLEQLAGHLEELDERRRRTPALSEAFWNAGGSVGK